MHISKRRKLRKNLSLTTKEPTDKGNPTHLLKSVFYFILFIMIYKFNRLSKELEIELITPASGKVYSGEYISISIRELDCEWNEILLDKKELYHLIGALHLLQKEMK